MKVDTELLEERQAKLTVAVPEDRVQKEMHSAARRIAKSVKIPGFRKGKAPYRVIVNYFGEGAILEEALDPLGQEVYKQALEESELEPYAPGSLSDMQMEPMVLTFTVPLSPIIELGEYRKVRVRYEAESVTDEDVQDALENMRDQQAPLDPVERPVEMGDIVMLDLKGTLVRENEDDDEADEKANDIWVNRADVRVKVSEDSTYPVPGFPEKIVGMKAGDEQEFDMSFPEEGEDLPEAIQGKTLHFEVNCTEVYDFNPPEVNDEFAKDHGFDDLAQLETELRDELESAAQQRALNEYMPKVFDTLFENIVSVEYAPVMVEDQIDRMLEDLNQSLQQRSMNLEEYKSLNNLSDEALRDDIREDAVRQLKEALILGEVIDTEELRARDFEIEDEISTTVLPYGENAQLMRQLFNTPQARESITRQLLARKSVERLAAIARGEDPPIGEPELDEKEEELSAELQAEVEAEETEVEEPPSSDVDVLTTDVKDPEESLQSEEVSIEIEVEEALEQEQKEASTDGAEDTESSVESNEDPLETSEVNQ